MQRVAVAAQRADGDAVVGEESLEPVELGRIVEHGQLAVRVAGIIAGTEFDGIDVQLLQLLEDFLERKLAEKRSKDANFHVCGPF